MALRLSKIALVAAVGLLMLSMAVNNISDYGGNFRYVSHVLAMDTVFADSQLTWRAIASPFWQRLVYGFMIAVELLTALLCLGGAGGLLAALAQPGSVFNQRKAIAIGGLTLSCLFWFVGFIVVGGEWFTMWQSPEWNVQPAAFQFFSCGGLVLIYLSVSDDPVLK
ncbi:MAG: DUF2165 family protein [Cyanobacteria bacterium REEB459]|nr:DUF2165 family protein [Cyanobacteria bacterium REEB459]